MGLMNSVGIIVAELLENGVDAGIVAGRHELPDDPLKTGRISDMSGERKGGAKGGMSCAANRSAAQGTR